jgi:hypothetical protein
VFTRLTTRSISVNRIQVIHQLLTVAPSCQHGGEITVTLICQRLLLVIALVFFCSLLSLQFELLSTCALRECLAYYRRE